MINTAYISLWGKDVGKVTWDEANDVGIFEYDRNFAKNNWNISPIKMPISESRDKVFYFDMLPEETFKGLPGLLADSLPDAYGSDLIDAWLKSQGRSGDLNPVEALCFIGNRGMGALEFRPSYSGLSDYPAKLKVENMAKVASEILAKKKNLVSKLSVEDEKYILEIFKIGTSVGGMRAKAIISFNPATNEVRSGQVDAPPGFSHWIIKFDGISKYGDLGESTGHGRIEMAYYMMVKDCGINMSQSGIFEENGRAHFMTKRFDRVDNKKIHMQSWCAIAHTDFNGAISSYEKLYEIMRRMKVPAYDYEEMYRRMVFNALAMNYDDHTKNFAFLMDENGKWKLSPAYDVTFSYKPDSPFVQKHCSSINGKRIAITKEDLLMFARRMSIGNSENIIKKISEVVNEWPSYARDWEVKEEKISEINNVLIRI